MTEQQPEAPAVPGRLVIPQDEFEAGERVAEAVSPVAAIQSPSLVSPEPGAASTGADMALPAEPHMNLLETAWGVIANAGWNDDAKTTGWQEAAERWRNDYHRWLDLHLRPGGYQTWEELAVSVTRERDALAFEVTNLRRALRDAANAQPLVVTADEERS